MSHSTSQIVGHDLQTEMCGRMAAMPDSDAHRSQTWLDRLE